MIEKVLAEAEQAAQKGQTTKGANEGPEVNNIFRRRLDRVGAIPQPMATPGRQRGNGRTTHYDVQTLEESKTCKQVTLYGPIRFCMTPGRCSKSIQSFFLVQIALPKCEVQFPGKKTRAMAECPCAARTLVAKWILAWTNH